jgi:hypothetical protein
MNWCIPDQEGESCFLSRREREPEQTGLSAGRPYTGDWEGHQR